MGSNEPRFIQTAHGRGYRFIGAVRKLPAAPSLDDHAPAAGIFVGREAELSRLHAAFASAASGRRQLVFVAGPASIGPGGLMNFFDEAPDSMIADAPDSHDIGFARHALLTDCYPTFPDGDRNTWHAFDGEFYFLESNGRPYKYLPPIVEAPRITSCKTAVGQWGDDEVSSNDYDGGHMIGSQLGGYGGRINLVPQDLNFNRGNWAQIENKAADCGALPDESIFYYVRSEYGGSSTALVPTTMSLILEKRDTGASMSFTFENVDAGGPDGTEYRIEAVNFLADQGCN